MYPPTTAEQITIYLIEDDVPGDYEKLAIINLKGDYNTTDEEMMYKKARKEAAKYGANGILVYQVEDPGTGAKVADALLGTGATRKGRMIAIRVTE